MGSGIGIDNFSSEGDTKVATAALALNLNPPPPRHLGRRSESETNERKESYKAIGRAAAAVRLRCRTAGHVAGVVGVAIRPRRSGLRENGFASIPTRAASRIGPERLAQG
jgi:hypothetical protein